jgi:hypothetical protein
MAIKEAICEAIQEASPMWLLKMIEKLWLMQFSIVLLVHEFSTLVSKIKSLLSLYSNFEMKFIKRQINIVVHTLAMMTYSCPRCCLFDLIPLYIENYLINNMSWNGYCKKNHITYNYIICYILQNRPQMYR